MNSILQSRINELHELCSAMNSVDANQSDEKAELDACQKLLRLRVHTGVEVNDK